MIPKEIKALIDEHCMGIKDAGKISPEVMDLIMKTAEQKKADDEEVQKYMEEVISGPTKAEREAIAKAEAERKAKAEAERKAKAEAAERKKQAMATMEKLIGAALADGELTDKERKVLLKKAAEERLDVDEFEMLLDARLHEVKAEIARKEKEEKARKEKELAALKAKAEAEVRLKQEAETRAKEKAEREKKEAIFQELKKKYPTADISGIDDKRLYNKPIDKWEDEFKASAKQQAVKKRKQAFEKIKNIAYWVVFFILLIFTSVWVYQFAESTWDKVLSTILILMGFGVNLYYRLKEEYEDKDVDLLTIWSAGLLWQHFFVKGFWMTLLSVAFIIILFGFFMFSDNINDNVKRTMTWIIVALLYLSLLAYPFLGL